MRALSIRQPWAELIARGEKKIEYRTWARNFRGDLLVVASVGRQDELCREEGFDPDDLVYGRAVCVVDFHKVTGHEGDYKWHLANPRRVEPVPITGYASIYNVDDEKIRLTKTCGPERKPKPTRPDRRPVSRNAPLVVVLGRHERTRTKTAAAVRDAGFRVKVARDGLAGWRLIAGLDAVHAVLMDQDISGYSAHDVAQRVLESKQHRRARVVILGDSSGRDEGIAYVRGDRLPAIVAAVGTLAT